MLLVIDPAIGTIFAAKAILHRVDAVLEEARYSSSYKATGDFAPTFVSQNIRDWLGYNPQEYLAHADFWRRCVHPDDLAAVEAESVLLFQKGRHTVEYRFLKKDGTYLLGE
jgi:PAS domain-containing protein